MRRLTDILSDTQEIVLAPGAEIDADPVMASWALAASEARRAYREWCRARDAESYVTYRACADRADAAQDALALGAPTRRPRTAGVGVRSDAQS